MVLSLGPVPGTQLDLHKVQPGSMDALRRSSTLAGSQDLPIQAPGHVHLASPHVPHGQASLRRVVRKRRFGQPGDLRRRSQAAACAGHPQQRGEESINGERTPQKYRVLGVLRMPDGPPSEGGAVLKAQQMNPHDDRQIGRDLRLTVGILTEGVQGLAHGPGPLVEVVREPAPSRPDLRGDPGRRLAPPRFS